MPLSRIITAFITGCLLLAAAAAEDLNVVTTDFPPYSYERDGKINGMSTEIVKRTLEEADQSYHSIRVYPWARTYHIALNQKNTLIYSIARSKDREKAFHWIGKIAPYNIHLYRLKSRTDIRVHTLEDAKKYIVSGEYSDIKQEYLVKKGFVRGKNLHLVSSDELSLRLLFAGRTDLIPFNEFSLPIMLEKEGHTITDLVPVLHLEEISYDLYMALSKSTSPEIAQRLREAFERLVESGQIAKIHERYLNNQTAWVE